MALAFDIGVDLANVVAIAVVVGDGNRIVQIEDAMPPSSGDIDDITRPLDDFEWLIRGRQVGIVLHVPLQRIGNVILPALVFTIPFAGGAGWIREVGRIQGPSLVADEDGIPSSGHQGVEMESRGGASRADDEPAPDGGLFERVLHAFQGIHGKEIRNGVILGDDIGARAAVEAAVEEIDGVFVGLQLGVFDKLLHGQVHTLAVGQHVGGSPPEGTARRLGQVFELPPFHGRPFFGPTDDEDRLALGSVSFFEDFECEVVGVDLFNGPASRGQVEVLQIHKGQVPVSGQQRGMEAGNFEAFGQMISLGAVLWQQRSGPPGALESPFSFPSFVGQVLPQIFVVGVDVESLADETERLQVLRRHLI